MIYTIDLPLKALSINTHSSNKSGYTQATSPSDRIHTSPSDCKHIQATQFSDQIPRTYSVTNFGQMSQQYFLPERMALNVEQTHQHFEDSFTQRNKRRNHHHNTSFITTLLSERGALVLSSFTPIKKGSVWIEADGLALGLAIAGRYGTHINTSVQTLQRLQLLVFQD